MTSRVRYHSRRRLDTTPYAILRPLPRQDDRRRETATHFAKDFDAYPLDDRKNHIRGNADDYYRRTILAGGIDTRPSKMAWWHIQSCWATLGRMFLEIVDENVES